MVHTKNFKIDLYQKFLYIRSNLRYTVNQRFGMGNLKNLCDTIENARNKSYLIVRFRTLKSNLLEIMFKE